MNAAHISIYKVFNWSHCSIWTACSNKYDNVYLQDVLTQTIWLYGFVLFIKPNMAPNQRKFTQISMNSVGNEIKMATHLMYLCICYHPQFGHVNRNTKTNQTIHLFLNVSVVSWVRRRYFSCHLLRNVLNRLGNCAYCTGTSHFAQADGWFFEYGPHIANIKLERFGGGLSGAKQNKI